jgi:protein tyrosine/serine phosphatase
MRNFLLLFSILLATSLTAAEPHSRSETWAVSVPCENLGNCHRLDSKAYRSSQPSRKGFKEAIQLGIKNVLNLRDHHSDDDETRGLNIKTYRVQMEAGDIKEEQLIAALKIIKNSDGPILIHCWHGSDRTGLVCAAYRIVFQDWTREAALDELVNGGFGYHKSIYKNITRWIENSDFEALKKKVFAP